MCSVVFMCA